MDISVSGSDRQANASTDHLAEAGATIHLQQVAPNLIAENGSTPDVVLLSSAIDVENEERQAAELMGLPVVKRSEFLPVLLAERELLAVAGTHGKSTTTSMIVKILRDAGIDAGYIIGTRLPGFGNAAAGTHPTSSSKPTNMTACSWGCDPRWQYHECGVGSSGLLSDACQLPTGVYAIC